MKLYWRFKKDGKWTWRSATLQEIVENEPRMFYSDHEDGLVAVKEEEE